MAKATKVINWQQVDPEEQKKQELEELENALLENKDVIYDTLEIMKGLQDREIFNMGKALIHEDDAVLERLLNFVNSQDITGSLKNLLLSFDLIGTVEIEKLEPVMLKLNSAVSQMGEYERDTNGGSYTSLLQAMKDPDVIEGMNLLMAFLKGFGSSQKERKKTDAGPAADSKDSSSFTARIQNTAAPQPMSTKNKVSLIAVGASLVAIPFFFLKK